MNALGKDAVVLSHGVFPVSQRRGQVAIGSGGLPPLDFLVAFLYIIFLSRPCRRARLHPRTMNASMIPTDGVSRFRVRIRMERMRQ